MFKTLLNTFSGCMVEIIVNKEQYENIKNFCNQFIDYDIEETNYLEDYEVCYKMYVKFASRDARTIKKALSKMNGVISVR